MELSWQGPANACICLGETTKPFSLSGWGLRLDRFSSEREAFVRLSLAMTVRANRNVLGLRRATG
jgi:hypothetical protein